MRIVNSVPGKNPKLDDLLFPLSQRDFFKYYYGRKPYHRSTPSTAPYPLFTYNDFISRITCSSLEYGFNFKMARHGKWLDPVFHQALFNDTAWLSDALNKDWTVITKLLNNDFLPLHELAEDLASTLKSRIHINSYYSSANAIGFGQHRDPCDVLIWQQSGKKVWRVYSRDKNSMEEPLIETTLEPGQLLYIPQNFIHSAQSDSEQDSLHLTIAFTSRYSQIITLIKDHLDDWLVDDMTSGLSGLVTPDSISESQTNITSSEILLALNALRTKIDEDEYPHPDFVAHSKTITRNTTTDQVLGDLKNNGKTCSFKLLEPIHVSLNVQNQATVVPGSGKLTFRAEYFEPLKFIAENQRFSLKELSLAENESKALCNVLIGAGLLEPWQS